MNKVRLIRANCWPAVAYFFRDKTDDEITAEEEEAQVWRKENYTSAVIF
jgi:hypothetical protein